MRRKDKKNIAHAGGRDEKKEAKYIKIYLEARGAGMLYLQHTHASYTSALHAMYISLMRIKYDFYMLFFSYVARNQHIIFHVIRHEKNVCVLLCTTKCRNNVDDKNLI